MGGSAGPWPGGGWVLLEVFHVGLLHWRILPCAPFVLA